MAISRPHSTARCEVADPTCQAIRRIQFPVDIPDRRLPCPRGSRPGIEVQDEQADTHRRTGGAELMSDKERGNAVLDDDGMLEHRLDNIAAMLDFLRNPGAWTPEDVQRIEAIIREMVGPLRTSSGSRSGRMCRRSSRSHDARRAVTAGGLLTRRQRNVRCYGWRL
jgi:hypothetical protein